MSYFLNFWKWIYFHIRYVFPISLSIFWAFYCIFNVITKSCAVNCRPELMIFISLSIGTPPWLRRSCETFSHVLWNTLVKRIMIHPSMHRLFIQGCTALILAPVPGYRAGKSARDASPSLGTRSHTLIIIITAITYYYCYYCSLKWILNSGKAKQCFTATETLPWLH